MLSSEDEAIYSNLYKSLRSNITPEALANLFRSAEADTKDLFPILSKVYEEIKLKHVPVSPEIQLVTESKLIDLQFISPKSQKEDSKVSFSEIRDHLNFTCELIRSLLQKYLGKEFEIDMEFVFHATYVAQHMSVLKRRMDYTYALLPWEEMQFCLATYLNGIMNPEKTDVIYKLIINKNRIFTYLNNFLSKLSEIKLQFKEDDLKQRKDHRKQLLKESVLKESPVFEDLYKDFSILRDVYSLEKINFYITKSLTVNIEERETIGQLVIERTLQVIGEYIKNTPDSPNLSDDLYKSLLKSAPRNLRKILSSLRNMLSHALSLNRKLELESSRDPDFFKQILSDLQKIQIDVVYILYKQKIDAVRLFLKRLLDLQDIEDIKSVIKQAGIQKMEDEGHEYTINVEEFREVKRLVSLFCEKVTEDSSEDSEAIEEVLDSLKSYETKIKQASVTYAEGINQVVELIRANQSLDAIKSMVRTYLSMLSAAEPQSLFNDIFIKLRHIFENVKIRRKVDPNNYLDPDVKALEISKILTEIYNFLKWRLPKIKWLKEMEDRLTLNEEKSEKENKAKEIFEMVLDKLESADDRMLIEKAIKKVQQNHLTKYELIDLVGKETEDFPAKVKSLGLSSKRHKEILYNNENSHFDKLLYMIKAIDDDYGTFLKKLADMFPLSKYTSLIKAFYSSLKIKKSLQIKVYKAIDDAVNDKVIHCYRRLLMKMCLKNVTKISNIREDEHLAIFLEMLVLDLTEFLENIEMLSDNKLFLVKNVPILIGKQLRNYLAHGDVLIGILPYDYLASIIFHANRLVNIGENILTRKDIGLGYRLDNSIFSFEQYFDNSLKVIRKQIRLFDRAQYGQIEEIQEIIQNGADICGTNYDERTALSFAIHGKNQASLEYLIEMLKPLNDDVAYDLLILAVSLGNMENTQFLIHKMQLDINHNGSSLLNLALAHGQEQMATFLLENGVRFDVKDSKGKTSLHFASENGCLKIVKFLVKECKEIIDSVTTDSLTAQHLAAQNGHTDVVKLLINNNANVNMVNTQGFTVLQMSALYGHVDVMEYILGASDCDLSEEAVIKTLNLATKNGHWDVIKRLLSISTKQTKHVLHLASLYGHLNIVAELICKGVDINSQDASGKNALHLASQCGHRNVVKLLIENGMDSNMPDNDGWTSIHWAVQNGHTDVVQLLISNNVNVNIGDKQGLTAFHLAAQHGNVNLLNVLLSFKANPNAVTNKGRTALHVAAHNGHCSVIEAIINTGKINIDAKDIDEETALIVAADNGHTDVVELLLKLGAKVNHQNKDGICPLTRAAGQGHLDILVNLIKYKADIEIQENTGWRPLNWAVQNGYTDILDVLLKCNVNVNATFGHGAIALHTAVRNGHIDIVNKLIKYGSNINAMMRTILPLRVAANYGHTDIVLALLDSGADVDAMGSDKVTPLHSATWNGHTEVVKVLLKHNANVHSKTEEDWTALHFATKFGFLEIVNVLLENSADIYAENNSQANAFHTACEVGHINVVEMLLHIHNVDINVKGSNGMTGLHWAAANARVDVVNLLINNKADVDIVDQYGATALHCAAHNSGSALVVRALIQHKCNINIKDSKGATPLHLAIVNGNEDVILELLENHANVNAESNNISPLHLAVALGRRSILKPLLERGAIVNSSGFRNKTCLHIAAEKGYQDIIQILLEYKANAHLKDETGRTALHWAVEKEHEVIVKWLIENSNINSVDFRRQTALQIALDKRNEDIALFLIERGAEVQKIRTEHDNTYLHLACRGGMLKVVRALLKQGSDVRVSCKLNQATPLHESLNEGHDLIANILIKSNAEVNAATVTGWTALHMAADKGMTHIIQQLLSRSANVNAATKNGETPLYFASMQGHSTIVDLLLQNAARVDVKTISNKLTALSVAAQNGHTEVLKTLIRHNADVNSKEYQGLTPLHIASLNGHEDCVRMLLESKANVNAVTTNGWTALHVAVVGSYVDIVKILLSSNDIRIVDDRNDQGDSALDLAKNLDHQEIATILSEYNDNSTAWYISIYNFRC